MGEWRILGCLTGLWSDGEGISPAEGIDDPRARPEDGLEATLNSMSKRIMAVFWAAVILWRHDGEALWAIMGAVINVLLSVALKEIINQERPFPTPRSDPGMPSSHAQSIFYTITFVILCSVKQFGLTRFTTTLSGLVFILGSYFSWLRIAQQLHTISQVVVGAMLGFSFFILWIWTWNMFILNSFESSYWVRIVVLLSATGSVVGYLYHVYGPGLWMKDD